MKNNLLLIPALAALLALSGCMTAGALVEGAWAKRPAEATGVVFVALGAGDEWPAHAQCHLWGRSVSNPDARFRFFFKKPGLGPAGKALDALFEEAVESRYEDGPVEGAVLVLRLPPGEYQIDGGGVVMQGGGLFYPLGNRIAFKFEVQANRATYLGEYIPYPRKVARALFFRVPTGGVSYGVRNRLSRDLPLLARAGEQFSPDQVLPAVMTPADAKGMDVRGEGGE